jgi:predicted 3-demethylubiquinone-9 3-methyltransferase (glyoxalase superfamily)
MSRMAKTTPFLWFDGTAEEAANLYVSVFPNSTIDEVMGTPGSAMGVRFTLDGARFHALNGGPMYQFTPAISFQIACADQAEIDHYWAGLSAGGGEPGQCGWLKDRFGLSWQVIPQEMGRYLGGPDAAGAARAQRVMMGMRKLVIEDLRRAYEGE